MPGRLGVKPCPCAEGTGFPWGEVRTASPHSGYIVEVKDGHAKVEGQRGPRVHWHGGYGRLPCIGGV